MTNTTDSTSPDVIKTIGQTLKQFFDIRRERAELKLKYDKRIAKATAKFQKADEPLAQQEALLFTELRTLIIPNKAMLLSGKLKSFATTFGIVSFGQKAESYKVVDPKAFEKKARQERRLTQLGKFVRSWKPDANTISNWLKSDPKAAERYSSVVEKVGGYDELSVKPNDSYLTDYDPNRLTAKSVNLGQVVEDVQDD